MGEFFIFSGDVAAPQLLTREPVEADSAEAALQAWVNETRPNPEIDYWAVDRSAITHASLTVDTSYQIATSGI